MGRHRLTTDESPLDELRERARSERVSPFRVDVHPERERVVIAPAGEVDVATVDALGAQIDELATAGFPVLVLDLRGVTFLDSTGLSLIVRQCRRTDVDVLLVDGAETVARLFDVTGLRDELPFLAPHDAPARRG